MTARNVEAMAERLERKAEYTDRVFDNHSLGERYREAAAMLRDLQAENKAKDAEIARFREAWEDHMGQMYAPWTPRDPEDTLGAMIDNQAWVMMSHIGSYIGEAFDDPDMMEKWQEEWAENHETLLKHWFSPHRAMASFVAEKLISARAALAGGTNDD